MPIRREMFAGARLLREWCRRQDIREYRFAEQIGVPKSQLSTYMNGYRAPSLGRACVIEVATNGAVPIQSWTRGFIENRGLPRADFRRLIRAAQAFWADKPPPPRA